MKNKQWIKTNEVLQKKFRNLIKKEKNKLFLNKYMVTGCA